MSSLVEEILERIRSRRSFAESYVLLSFAQSLDGCIAYGGPSHKDRLILSGPKSMALTHALRRSVDAVAVGINTVFSDDPLLTVRMDLQGAPFEPELQPAAVVFDSKLRFPFDSRLARNMRRRLIVVTLSGDNDLKLETHASGLELLKIPGHERIDFKDALNALKSLCAIHSLMVEGGASIIQSALPHADDLLITIAPCLLPGGLKAIDGGSHHPQLLSLRDPLVCHLDADTIVYGTLVT